MPDNPQTPNTPWFSLYDHRLVVLQGRDAVAFAQAQTMNDVGLLRDGDWHWNGWLTPKGRVIALFALLRIDADTLWMIVPDADADALVERLRRFVFRSKVGLSVRDDVRVAGRLRASDLASGNHWAGDPASAIELDLSGRLDADHAGRSLRLGPGVDAESDPAALETWRRADLAHGWPRLEPSQSEQWTPQQLSLDRLQAYSVKKGCYPGQEIVARTHFLGQAKRGLGLLRTTPPLSPGAEVSVDGTATGTVVAVGGDLALAVLSLGASSPADAIQNDESPAGGGASWVRLPLRDGLAR
jgi:folate-binding protein YgfZ